MFRVSAAVLLLSFALLLPTPAAAAYPVQDKLCDVAVENCRTQILDLINAEDQSIDVAFWFMEDARYSNAIINRFNAGVKVRVLFDTDAFTGKDAAVRQQIIGEMQAAGIPLRYKSSGGILHWKLMVFGGQRIANFSAANFSGVGYVPVTPYANYEDEVVVFTTDSGLVDTFMTKYDDVWTTVTGYTNYANVTTLDRYHPTTALDPRLNFPPTQDYGKKISSQIDKETVAVDVDMYRITDSRPADAMIRAVQRGVPARLYTEQEQYRDPTRFWHSYNVDRMYAAGVQVRDRAHEGLNHQKSVVLRGQRMVVDGSSNWTTPSASQQLEHNLFTTDQTFYDFFVAQFERKWNNTGPSAETKAFVPLPPDKPIYNAPANAATGVPSGSVTLTWNAGLWAHLYDIYFGTTPNPPLIATDVALGPSASPTSYRSYTVSGIVSGTTYYWRVVSKTMANMTAAGSVSSFTTSGGSGGGGGALPTGWSSSDVGSVGAPGSTTYDTTTGSYILNGSGADIWGTADAFQFASTDLTGDGEIVARVTSISNTNSWTKTGVMMRDSLAAGAPQASIFISVSRGAAFQRRTVSGGTSTSTAGPMVTAPYWVKLTRSGNTFTGSVSSNGSTWTVVGSQTIAMGSTIKVGLPLTSHLDGSVATSSLDSVSVTGGGAPPPPPPPPTLPSGWATTDIGAVSPSGSTTYDSGTATFTITGAGADIWGTADAFRYAYSTLAGDGEIVAHVAAVQNVDPWTKAGVMIRAALATGSAQASMFVSSGKGSAFQRRTTTNGLSASNAGPFVAAPYWVKVSRVGTTLTAFVSTDGATWTQVGGDTIAMGSSVYVGLAVTSHRNGTPATATFDSVTVTPY